MEGAPRTRRLRPFYRFCCPPAAPRTTGRRDAGAKDKISWPYSRHRSNRSKNAPMCLRIAPTSLMQNGKNTLVFGGIVTSTGRRFEGAASTRLSRMLDSSAETTVSSSWVHHHVSAFNRFLPLLLTCIVYWPSFFLASLGKISFLSARYESDLAVLTAETDCVRALSLLKKSTLSWR